jgi:hypothetical protein
MSDVRSDYTATSLRDVSEEDMVPTLRFRQIACYHIFRTLALLRHF